VQQFMAKAKRLREQAEQQAEKGAYEEAIHTLEQSTKEIVRAIRSAGIYIPG
jgi:HEPN domain-containing protein